jgi:hypothetical protein
MRSKKRIALAQTWLVMGVLTAGMMRATAFGQTSQVDNADWPLRSSEIHWPAGHTPADADLFAHNELLIHASCSIVWQADLARMVSKLTQCEAAEQSRRQASSGHTIHMGHVWRAH